MGPLPCRGQRVLRAALFVLVALGGGAAQAQMLRDVDPQAELERDRASVASPGAAPVPGLQGFVVDLTIPVLFSTNPELEGTDVAVGGGGDWHFNPDLLLRWSRQFAAFRLTAAADLSVDRFFSRSDADLDTAFGSVTLAWTDGRSRLFVPYFGYSLTADFAPTFAEHEDTLHDFSLGFTSSFGLDPMTGMIPARDASAPGRLLAAFDLRGGRRIGDPSDFTNTFIIAKLDFSYVLDNHWFLELTPKARMRWYDDFAGGSRRDTKLSAVLRLGWTPDWLTLLNRRGEIDFVVSYARDYSTLPEARFTDWEFGPSLLLSWRF